MIAKVRIASLEQWYKGYYSATNLHPMAGVEVEIIPNSMQQGLFEFHDEPCRRWMLTENSVTRLDAKTGFNGSGRRWHLCEHLLEMD